MAETEPLTEKPPPAQGKYPLPGSSSFLYRWCRLVRKSLEDDGAVGRITSTKTYRTLRNIGIIILTPYDSALWILEGTFGQQLIALTGYSKYDEEDDLHYSFIGAFLSSEPFVSIHNVVICWLAVHILLWLTYVILSRFTLDEDEIAERDMKAELDALEVNTLKEVDQKSKGFLERVVSGSIFRYIWIGFLLISVAEIGLEVYINATSEESQSFNPGHEDFLRVNPYRRPIPTGQDDILREGVSPCEYENWTFRRLTTM